MKAQLKLYLAVLLLVLVGSAVAAFKSIRLGLPFWEGQRVEEILVEARISFMATGQQVKARLSLPAAAIDQGAGQQAGSLGYHYHVERELGEYTAVWSSERRDEAQVLFYRVRLQPGTQSGGEPLVATAKPSPPEVPVLPGVLGTAMKNVVSRATAVSADPDSLFVALFEQVQSGHSAQEVALLRAYYEREFRPNADIMMGIDLLGLAGVAARLCYGVRVDEERTNLRPVPLIEYYDGAYWKVRDPAEPSTVLDGRRIFVWHRGGGPLLDVTGGENSQLTFSVIKDRVPLSTLSDLKDSPLLISTILGLPASERAVFRYIVLIPLGAFVVVIMRNIVGISTLGTFMPVLLALALLETELRSGLIMFSVLVAAGLWIRFLLSRLHLLVVPRVAACVVIVTLLMMLMSVVGSRLGMGTSVQITLFPMIIIAWTIERMSLIWEEEGQRNAITQVAGSVLVAVCAYLFMKISQVRYWAFYFPELLLVLLAFILLVGRYTGYRLSELIRFRTFAHG